MIPANLRWKVFRNLKSRIYALFQTIVREGTALIDVPELFDPAKAIPAAGPACKSCLQVLPASPACRSCGIRIKQITENDNKEGNMQVLHTSPAMQELQNNYLKCPSVLC